MPKLSFRLFILPLGAISMFASLASQNVPQAPERESMIQQVRSESLACARSPGAHVCGPGVSVAR